MESKESDKKPEPSTEPEAKSTEGELAEEQLEVVSGGAGATGGAGAGKVVVHDISITKVYDKSSP